MKKLLSLSLAMLMIASCAVGCGDEDDDDSSSSRKKRSSSSSSFSENDDDDLDEDEDEEDDDDEDDEDEDNEDEDDDDEDDEDADEDDSSSDKKKKNSSKNDSSKNSDTKKNDSKKNSSKNDNNNKEPKITPKNGSAITESDVIGKWEAEKLVTDQGVEMTDLLGIPFAVAFQFEFKSDGTCVVSEQMMDLTPDEKAPKVSWEIDGNSLVVTVDDSETSSDDSLSFNYEDGKLVARNIEEDMEGALYLVKVDKFTEFDINSIMNDLDFGDLDLGDIDLGDLDIGDID
ncbi:MAG TPA: hypothetical protein P5191_04065 [Ruminococcus sp.]|nr:hypothetical protein [Ruminococcus sp.]